MKKWLIIGLLAWSTANAQEASVIKLDKLQQIMNGKEDKVLVLNFWATWCGPCVAELPLFETLNASGRRDVEVALVSLDLELDPNPEKVYRFIRKKKIQSPVYLLDEKDANTWIDKIEEQWSGSLPATIVINKQTGKRKFIGNQIHEGDLEKLIAEVKDQSN
jgi:thiol-disulfide isomerase/thioredoxin